MYFVGLDVHAKRSSLCIVDQGGRTVKRMEVRGTWPKLLEQVAGSVPRPFAVCYEAAERGIGPSQILSVLPPSAEDLLRATAIEGPQRMTYCSDVTVEQARTLAETFDAAGLEPDERSANSRLGYAFEPSVQLAPGPIENTVSISFEPYLPHGVFPCSPCG